MIYKREKKSIYGLTISLLLFVVFSQFIAIPVVYAQTNNRLSFSFPMPTATSTAASDSCVKQPISSISAGGGKQDPNHPSQYAIDNNLGTRWSRYGSGSWIKPDLGVQMDICSVDIAWHRGDLRQNSFVISVSTDGTSFTKVFSGKSSARTSSFETYTLPSSTTGRYVKITVNGNTENSWASISELRINRQGSSTTSPSLYDDFEGSGTYTLSDGQTSPNGKWLDKYNGHGSAGVQKDGITTNKVFFMYPKTSTSTSETHANLVISKQAWSNFDMSINAKTVKQLRQNSPPNKWEVAWVMFRYTDTFHHYAFLVKPNGIEFEKKDCDTCTNPVQGEKFLVTATSPTLKIGSWSNWKISAIGNHFIITVNGVKVVDYIDQKMSPKLARGSIAMYDEDASVRFDNVYVTPR
jgi:hypothetical protein